MPAGTGGCHTVHTQAPLPDRKAMTLTNYLCPGPFMGPNLTASEAAR
jgi:hypothetical protein